MIKIVLLLTIIFITSCSFFSRALSVASKNSECIKLSPKSGLNMESVCVGEMAYILRTKTSGKIIGIDTSNIEDNKAETIFFQIEDKKGYKVRMTGKEVVLNKKGLCLQSQDEENLCVGDKYHSLSDGDERSIIGFSLSTVIDQYVNVYSKNISDKSLHSDFPWDVFTSMTASKAGIIQDVASCRETLLMKTDDAIIKCAKKQLIQKLDKTCDIFRHGNGRVLADIETRSIQSKCSKNNSMLRTSIKTCTVELETKCVKTKKVESFIIIHPENSPDVNAEEKSDTV